MRSVTLLSLVAALTLGYAGSAQAATCNYVGGAGSTWNNPASWSCDGTARVPITTDAAVLAAGRVATVTAATNVGHLAIAQNATLKFAADVTLGLVQEGGTDGALKAGAANITGAGRVVVSGALSRVDGNQQLQIADGADLLLDGPNSVHDQGFICLFGTGSPTLQVRFGAVLTLAPGSNANTFNCTAGNVIVDGTLIANNSGGTTVNPTIDVDGTVEVRAGTLTLANGGGMTANDIDGDSGFLTATGPGARLHLRGSGHQLVAPALLSATNGGVIESSGETVVRPGANLNMASFDLTGGVTTLEGTTTVNVPTLNIGGGGSLVSTRRLNVTNLAVGEGTVAGDHSLTVSGTFGRTSQAQFQIADGADLIFAGPPSNHDQGSICLFGTGTPTFQIAPGRMLTVAAGSDSNTFNCTAGHVIVDGTLIADNPAGTHIGNAVDVDGVIRAQQGILTLANGGGTSTNDLDVDSGQFVAQGPGARLHFSGGTHVLGSGAQLHASSGGVAQNSAATFLRNGAALNVSRLEATGGEMNLEGSSAATIPELVLSNGGSVNSTRNLAVSVLSVAGGRVRGDHELTVSGNLTRTADDEFRIADGADVVLNLNALHDQGFICLTGTGDPTLRIPALRTLVLGAGSNPNTFNCASGTLVVEGTLAKSGTANATTIRSLTRVAGGTLNLSPGQTMHLVGGLTQTAGSTTVATGATLGADAPRSISGGTLTVDGILQGTTTLTGAGVLRGDGRTGPVTNTSGTIRPGSSPGLLTIDGPFTQGPGGTLEIEIASTQPEIGFDVLDVNGLATLGGFVRYVHLDGFVPADSNTFQFLRADSRNGVFDGAPSPLVGDPLPAGKSYALDYTAPVGARLVVDLPDPPVNVTRPVVTPNGSTLTCDPGTWTNEPTFAFQWLRDGSPIAGATSPTYVVSTQDDAGHALSCRVTATNGGGQASAESDPRAIAAVAPQSTGKPTVTGRAAVGQQLTCDPGTFSGAPAPTVTLQWLRDGQPIEGATGSTYTLTNADAGRQITCRATATNGGGSASATSDEVAVPAAATPTPTPTPAPGTPQEQKLSTSTPTQVAQALGLPSARKCQSRRRIQLRIKQPAGVTIDSAEVRLNRKKVRVRKVRGRFVATIDLRGFSKGSFTVDITVRTKSGLRLKGQRKYRTCTPRSRSGRGGSGPR